MRARGCRSVSLDPSSIGVTVALAKTIVVLMFDESFGWTGLAKGGNKSDADR